MTDNKTEPLVQPDVPEIGTEVTVVPTEVLARNKWNGVDIFRTKSLSSFPDDWKYKLQAPSKIDVELDNEVDGWIRDINETKEIVETSLFYRDTGFDAMRDRYLKAADDLVNYTDNLDIDTLGEAKGMLTRCIKKDQPDWYTVYYLLGKPSYKTMQQGKSAINRLQDGIRYSDGEEASAAIQQLEEYGILQRYRNFIERVNSGLEYGALTREELLERIHQIDPMDFEHFIADQLEADGWRATVTEDQYYEKGGVDMIAEKDRPFSQKIAAQVKRYDPNNGRHGTKVVRSYNSIHKTIDGADISAVFATNEFTDDARELAEETELRLIDGDGLANFIEGIGGYHIVNQDKY
ncbi:restriction endonuclease [Halomicrobium salinisoli]|uniref:restriction endonuclease n=1 Tax=Halomicrobium salinisoli TaxID=2878391 RepID=UPI001CF076CB|nr:restriction endonuclease [Halomicrobium salinisoli]